MGVCGRMVCDFRSCVQPIFVVECDGIAAGKLRTRALAWAGVWWYGIYLLNDSLRFSTTQYGMSFGNLVGISCRFFFLFFSFSHNARYMQSTTSPSHLLFLSLMPTSVALSELAYPGLHFPSILLPLHHLDMYISAE